MKSIVLHLHFILWLYALLGYSIHQTCLFFTYNVYSRQGNLSPTIDIRLCTDISSIHFTEYVFKFFVGKVHQTNNF